VAGDAGRPSDRDGRRGSRVSPSRTPFPRGSFPDPQTARRKEARRRGSGVTENSNPNPNENMNARYAIALAENADDLKYFSGFSRPNELGREPLLSGPAKAARFASRQAAERKLEDIMKADAETRAAYLSLFGEALGSPVSNWEIVG